MLTHHMMAGQSGRTRDRTFNPQHMVGWSRLLELGCCTVLFVTVSRTTRSQAFHTSVYFGEHESVRGYSYASRSPEHDGGLDARHAICLASYSYFIEGSGSSLGKKGTCRSDDGRAGS